MGSHIMVRRLTQGVLRVCSGMLTLDSGMLIQLRLKQQLLTSAD
jgi:hypothetical protein